MPGLHTFGEHASIGDEYQVTKGENGFVYQIENELGGQWKSSPTNRVPNPTATAYMELLEAAARRNGIDVPLTQNQPNMNSYCCQGCSNVKISTGNSSVVVALTQGTGMSVVMLQSGIRVLTLSRSSAYQTWIPTLTNDPFAPETETIIVQGPYLVRGATILGSTVLITGALSGPTMLEVFAPGAVKHVTWNGQVVATQNTQYGSLIAQLSGVNQTMSLSSLTSWRYKGSLEEHKQDYNDNGSAWVFANHTTTPNPTNPASLPVLYVDDYGFHNGIHLFRGYFTGLASAVLLNIRGGTAFGYSGYLSGDHIGSFYGSADLEAGNGTYSFTNATYHAPSSGKENVLSVIRITPATTRPAVP